MATVAVLGTSVFTTTAGDKTITASPTLGDLIVIIAAATGVAGTVGALSVSDDQAGVNAAAYTKIFGTSTGFSTAGGIDIWIRNKLITSNASTVFTAVQTSSTGGGLVIYRVTGMSIVGLGAVRQANTANGLATTTPTIPFAYRTGTTFSGQLAALTGNVVLGGIGNGASPAALTPPPSWTEAPTPDLGYLTPPTGLETAFRNSGETLSSIVWGAASGTAWGGVVVELDASVPQYDWVSPGKPDKDANRFIQGPVGRQSTWMKGQWRRARSGILVPELAF